MEKFLKLLGVFAVLPLCFLGLGTTLSIIFMVLKLCHVIAWTWFSVFSPVLYPLAVSTFVLAVAVLTIFTPYVFSTVVRRIKSWRAAK